MLLFEGGSPASTSHSRARCFRCIRAGDTAIAVLTLDSPPSHSGEAAELANRASGIAVGKLGTATVSSAELQASFPT